MVQFRIVSRQGEGKWVNSYGDLELIEAWKRKCKKDNLKYPKLNAKVETRTT